VHRSDFNSHLYTFIIELDISHARISFFPPLRNLKIEQTYLRLDYFGQLGNELLKYTVLFQVIIHQIVMALFIGTEKALQQMVLSSNNPIEINTLTLSWSLS
jgi:hypothetical protein